MNQPFPPRLAQVRVAADQIVDRVAGDPEQEEVEHQHEHQRAQRERRLGGREPHSPEASGAADGGSSNGWCSSRRRRVRDPRDKAPAPDHEGDDVERAGIVGARLLPRLQELELDPAPAEGLAAGAGRRLVVRPGVGAGDRDVGRELSDDVWRRPQLHRLRLVQQVDPLLEVRLRQRLLGQPRVAAVAPERVRGRVAAGQHLEVVVGRRDVTAPAPHEGVVVGSYLPESAGLLELVEA